MTTKRVVAFRARSRKDEFSYKLGQYILENTDKHSRSILPNRVESRCEIPRLKLDRAYKDSYLSGAISIVKSINPRLSLPVNPLDVKKETILWIIKDKRYPLLTVGYPLEKIAEKTLFFNEQEPLLIDALKLLGRGLRFPKGSVSKNVPPFKPKPKNGEAIVTYTVIEPENNSIF